MQYTMWHWWNIAPEGQFKTRRNLKTSTGLKKDIESPLSEKQEKPYESVKERNESIH